MKYLLFLIELLALTSGKLWVYGPRELRDKFSERGSEIISSYANYGTIPYGSSMVSFIICYTTLPKCLSDLMQIFRIRNITMMKIISLDVKNYKDLQLMMQRRMRKKLKIDWFRLL